MAESIESKKKLKDYNERHHIQPFRGDIFFADLSCIRGRQFNKKGHPVVIISNNIGNFYSDHVIIALCGPIYSKNLPTHVTIDIDVPSSVKTEQIYTIKKNCLKSFIKKVSSTDMNRINEALRISEGLVVIPPKIQNEVSN